MDTASSPVLRPASWPSPIAVALVGCAFVATGAFLGASWLRMSVLLLPAGLWMIIIATTLTWWLRRTGAVSVPIVRTPAMLHSPVLPIVAPILVRPVSWTERALRWLNVSDDAIETTKLRLSAGLDAAGSIDRPLRIGLDVPAELRRIVTSGEYQSEVSWITVSAGIDDDNDLSRHDLDALIRQPPVGDAYVVARVIADRDASWYDWSTPRPLTYASVFPGSVDPERVTLSDVDWKNDTHRTLACRALEATALMARCTHRLDLADRLAGRRPVDASRVQSIMLSLAGTLATIEPPATAFEQGLARAVGAYYCSDAAACDNETRKRLVDLSAQVLGRDPESLLRQAAVRFGDLDDDSAMDVLLEADRALRAGTHALDVNHMAFLQSEVEHGLAGPLTLGRVAAGICLICAPAPDDQFQLLRDDVLDDLRFSGWLIGRDDDRALLIEIFRTLWRTRSGSALAA